MKRTMRKFLAIVLILAVSCLPLAAYAVPTTDTEVVSVGIIGSSDGPTAIIVAQRVDMDPPLWYQWGYESMEEMMEMYGMESEDEYYEMVAMELQWQEQYKQSLEDELVSLGGTAGITNIMVNGRFASFGAAVPEQTNGTTYAPVKPLITLMGGSVSFDAATQSITVKYGDEQSTLYIGETDMTLSSDGGFVETIDIGYAPYLKNGSAYIPVRALFEAIGCDVFWDEDYKTVVIIDKATIIAELDKDFTTLNKLMTMQAATPSGAQKMTMDASASVTLFDTIKGDKTAKATAGVTCLYDEDSLSLSAQYDIAALIDMIYKDVLGYDEVPADEVPLSMKSSKLDMIMNMAEGILYLKSPLLSEADLDIPSGAWIELESAEMFGAALDEITSALGDMTVGALIYESATSYSYFYQIHLYDELITTAKQYRAVIGDKQFTRSGNNYTLTIKDNGSGSLFAGMFGKSALDVNVTIKTDGSAITAVTGSFKLEIDEYGTSVLISGSIDSNMSGATAKLEVHVKNVVKVQAELTSKTETYTGTVPDAPPAGDTVVSLDELLYPESIENM